MDGPTIRTIYHEQMRRLLWFRGTIDATRNVGVLVLGVMIAFTFGLSSSTHLILFFGSLAIFALLIFELRAHRFAAIAEECVREIERNAFAPEIDPTVHAEEGWQARLADRLAHPRFTMTITEALASRIYRHYAAIFFALDGSWVAKLYLDPQPAASFSEFVHRADLGFVPWWVVLPFLIPFWGLFIVLIVWLRGKENGREPRY